MAGWTNRFHAIVQSSPQSPPTDGSGDFSQGAPHEYHQQLAFTHAESIKASTNRIGSLCRSGDFDAASERSSGAILGRL